MWLSIVWGSWGWNSWIHMKCELGILLSTGLNPVPLRNYPHLNMPYKMVQRRIMKFWKTKAKSFSTPGVHPEKSSWFSCLSNKPNSHSPELLCGPNQLAGGNLFPNCTIPSRNANEAKSSWCCWYQYQDFLNLFD